MAAYTFETITPEQAAGFGPSDTLAFTSTFANFSNIIVAYAGSTVTLGFLGREVTLGAGFTAQPRNVPIVGGATFVFATGASETLTGALGPNATLVEAIYGGDGADTLVAGSGDRLAGSAGADVFVIPTGLSGATIVDFQAGEKIAVATVTPTLTDYVEETLGDIGLATSFATSQIGSGRANFVLATIAGGGIAVFVDTQDNNTIGTRFTLENTSFAAIDHLSFITAPAGTLPPPPTAPAVNGQTLTGTPGADTLAGGPGQDTLQGLAGDDLLSGGTGDDSLDGGAGFDTVSYATATGSVTVTLGSSQGGGGGQGVDALVSIEGVIGGAFGDTLRGTTAAQTFRGGGGGDNIDGGGGGDSLFGEAGDDLIDGGVGALLIDGGDGADILFSDLTGSSPLLTILGGPGDDRISGSAASVSGGAGSDLIDLDGSGVAARIDGGEGADQITGGSATDTIAGGTGDDTITGGAGRDEITTGDGADLIVFLPGQSGASFESADMVLDWSGSDRLLFGEGLVVGAYAELAANDPTQAATLAAQAIGAGSNFVSVQVGADVLVFVDSADTNAASGGVRLVGRTLADIDAANFISVAAPETAAPAPPRLPTASTAVVSGIVGTVSGDMDQARLGLLKGAVFEGEPVQLAVSRNGASVTLKGSNFSYDANRQLESGSATTINLSLGDFTTSWQSRGVSIAPFVGWVSADANQEAFSTLLASQDFLGGSTGADLMRGYGGSDILYGAGGMDTIFGGSGDDVIFALYATGISGSGASAQTYLRGDEGNDFIAGGGEFDDINGNMGNDTAVGGAGDDYVVGGKDNDLLFGESGADFVYGNLGADTCDGGEGDDVIRGGQDNDVVGGGVGKDFVSGDRGDDTMTGGAGADIFHTFGEAGLDRVTDFSLAQGDRVQVDPGTQFSVAQVGADTVITMVGGGRMVLLGVTMTSLTGDWIFGA